jgi:regulator of nucleoside diphosphate kinase
MRKRFQLILTVNNFKLLMKHCFSKGLSVFNKRKLLAELNDASIVKDDALPHNIVRPGSKVLVRNISKRQTYQVHIVDEDIASGTLNQIPVTDPLSIALLGYSNGHRTEWEMADGVHQFEIVSVA